MSGQAPQSVRPKFWPRGLFLAKVLLAVVLIWFLVRNEYFDAETFMDALSSGWPVAAAGGAIFLATFAGALRWWQLLRVSGCPLPFWATFKITYLAAFSVTLLPGVLAGDAVRVAVLAEYFPNDYRQRLPALGAAVMIDRLLALAGAVAVPLFACLFLSEIILANPLLLSLAGSAGLVLLGMVGGAAAALVIGQSGPFTRLRQRWAERPVLGALDTMISAVFSYRRHVGTLLWTGFLSITVMVLSVYAFWVLLPPGTLDAAQTAFVAPLGLIVNMLPLTPGGIGVGETAFHRLAVEISGLGFAFAALFATFRVIIILVHLPALILLFRPSPGHRPR